MKLVKKIYEGISCFPDKNEFWNLYIVLMKEKEFFLDAFARKTIDLEYPAHYQHAYFTLDGQVLDFNQHMTTQLVTLFRQVILENQTTFMEELIMATQNTLEKKVRAVSLELGELMKAHDDKEAWTKAGELNGLLKKKKLSKYQKRWSKASALNCAVIIMSTVKLINFINSFMLKEIN